MDILKRPVAADLISAFGHARNRRDLDGLRKVLCEDLTYDDPQLPGGRTGREGYLQLLTLLWNQSPDLVIEPTGSVFVDDLGARFIHQWHGRGALRAERYDAQSDSRISRIDFELIEIYHIGSEQIKSLTIFQRSLY